MSLIDKIKEFEVLLNLVTRQFNEIKQETELLINNNYINHDVNKIDNIKLILESFDIRLNNLENNNLENNVIRTSNTKNTKINLNNSNDTIIKSNNVKLATRLPKTKDLKHNISQKNILYEKSNIITKEKDIKYIKDVKDEKMTKKEKFEKGKLIAESGLNYELEVYELLKNIYVSPAGEYFRYDLNTQDVKEITNTNKKHDLVCNYFISEDSKCRKIPIELKKYRTPDWSQISIEYDEHNKCWVPHSTSKVCKANKDLLAPFIKNMSMYNNKNPIFYSKTFKVAEWGKYKEENPDLVKDYYIDIPNDTIKKLYANTGCYYIQVSDGYGLYHLGNDIYGFGVPEFICEQVLRIRVKRCGTRRGNVRLKLVMSPQPKNQCSKLPKSPYSLDNIDKLPKIFNIKN